MTEFSSYNLDSLKQPGRLAWLVFRSLARFWASIFLPYFRFWGENEFKPGTVIIARNYGLQTWVYALRFFRKPVRIVLVDDDDNMKWFNIANCGGLEPVSVRGAYKKKAAIVKELSDKGEIVFLIIPMSVGGYTPTLMQELENLHWKMYCLTIESLQDIPLTSTASPNLHSSAIARTIPDSLIG